MISDAELDVWLRKLDGELLRDVRRDIDAKATLRMIRSRARQRRARLLVRAYWRDTLRVAACLVAATLLVLDAFGVRIGWLS